jgi:UDP:flavonoid glycosyltransferase YjiC (YdhE family)
VLLLHVLLQPYVMLGLELQRRGHDVVLATEQRMQPLVQQLGQGKLGYFKISGDPTIMLYGKKNQVHRDCQADVQKQLEVAHTTCSI